MLRAGMIKVLQGFCKPGSHAPRHLLSKHLSHASFSRFDFARSMLAQLGDVVLRCSVSRPHWTLDTPEERSSLWVTLIRLGEWRQRSLVCTAWDDVFHRRDPWWQPKPVSCELHFCHQIPSGFNCWMHPQNPHYCACLPNLYNLSTASGWREIWINRCTPSSHNLVIHDPNKHFFC